MKDSAACPRPCSSCPWLTVNHGKPHPDGWYTKGNRKRLWNGGLRHGDLMSCHKTDPHNPVPEGEKPVPGDTVVHECTGALILQQRELMLFQTAAEHSEAVGDKRGSFKLYRQMGGTMTKMGLGEIVNRAMLGGTPFGGLRMSRPDLNEPVSR